MSFYFPYVGLPGKSCDELVSMFGVGVHRKC